MPKVSILMAHSGPPTFVEMACRSIESQTYRDLELIVVDDGAGLDWDAYLGGVRFPWRVLLNSSPRGLARSLNRAAQVASGTLLARADSDDVNAATRLERQVSFLDERPRVDFLGSAVYWLDESHRSLGRSYPSTEVEDLPIALCAYNQMCHGSMIARREAFESLGGYDDSIAVAQDYELWLRAVRAGHSFANLPDTLYGLRLHSKSVSSRSRIAQNETAASLRRRVPTAEWCSRVTEWFAAGRDRRVGRPYESLQLGRFAVLFLASTVARRLEPMVRKQLLLFVARHAPSAAALLMRELGWRYHAPTKVVGLLRRL